LQKAGIGVLTDLEREATPGGPLLSITVATATQAQFPHLYALSIVVACHQNAVLERDLSIGAEKASTWSVSVLDLVDRQQLGTARERVTQLVDRFINAYLAVHPKQERSRH